MARNTVAVTHCIRMQGASPPAADVEVPQGDRLCDLRVTRLCDSHDIEKTVMLEQLSEIKELIDRLEHARMAYWRGMGTPGLDLSFAINKLSELYSNLGGDKTK
jgi:hypothetical protein